VYVEGLKPPAAKCKIGYSFICEKDRLIKPKMQDTKYIVTSLGA
jgi:hypothetical protein